MKAIVNTGPNRLEMLELTIPEPAAGQVRIRTGAVGICATDLEMVAGWERTAFPAIPGHEWSGTIDAIGGGVDSSILGKPCVAENVIGDGEVGFEFPGGYAEYFVTDAANIHLLPPDFSFETAALVEPLAVAIRGLNRLRSDAAGPVLIIGDGPIGLITTMLLSRRGVATTVVGGRNHRLALAQEFGATSILNYHEFAGDMAQEIPARTASEYRTVVEASGSKSAVDASISIVAPEGRILVIGDYAGACASFRWNHLLWREIELIGSNASAGAWDEAVRLATEEELPLARLITHRLDASEFAAGYEIMRNREAGAVKVVLAWQKAPPK